MVYGTTVYGGSTAVGVRGPQCTERYGCWCTEVHSVRQVYGCWCTEVHSVRQVCSLVYGGPQCTAGVQVEGCPSTFHRWTWWRRGLAWSSLLVMRLREPAMDHVSQPETHGWINKGFLIGTSAGFRLARTGPWWLAQAHHHHCCQPEAPPPRQPTVANGRFRWPPARPDSTLRYL